MRLKIREGLTAGLVVSIIGSVAMAGRSPEPAQTFAYVLSVALAMTSIAVGIVVAIDRRIEGGESR